MAEQLLTDKASACLAGGAIGDALGGATEGWEASEIFDHYGGYVEGIVRSVRAMKGIDKPISPFLKGDGHVTDDTLMTRVLAKAYMRKRDHLDAYDVEALIVPQLIEDKVWVPEYGRDELLYHRLFLAEKWLVLKLKHGHADPREAGTGNIVNCGAAMYIAPVGLVNAGDPDRAYAEAADIAGAHQSSYGREAAAVLAAAVAEAARPGATVDSIVATCLRLARDGTRAAIEAVAEAARGVSDWREAIPVLRAAFGPFDSLGEDYSEPGLGARVPSRLQSIEELPVALGFLVATDADYEGTVLGGVNYGRDSDSIASMGGSLVGALRGRSAVRRDWVEQVGEASRYDLEELGAPLAAVAVEVAEKDAARHAERMRAIDELTASPLEVTA